MAILLWVVVKARTACEVEARMLNRASGYLKCRNGDLSRKKTALAQMFFAGRTRGVEVVVCAGEFGR